MTNERAMYAMSQLDNQITIHIYKKKDGEKK